MDFSFLNDLITGLGFPIVAVIGMSYFLKAMYADQQKDKEKLYTELAECRQVNHKAIETIAEYASRLETIQNDVTDIKEAVIRSEQ